MTRLPESVQQQVLHRFRQVPPPWGDPPAPPATSADIEASERRLGFVLPPAVRTFYELVNGGGGFLGLINGRVDDRGSNAVDLYESFLVPEDDPEAPVPWEWRAGVLPLFYWGCNTYSCVDCTNADAPTMIERDGFEWVPDGRPFVQWLEDWANDRLHQSAVE